MKRLLWQGPVPTLGRGTWQEAPPRLCCSLPSLCLLQEPSPSFPFHLSLDFFPFFPSKPRKLRHHEMQHDIINRETFRACQGLGFFFFFSFLKCLAICQHVLIEPTRPYGTCSPEGSVSTALESTKSGGEGGKHLPGNVVFLENKLGMVPTGLGWSHRCHCCAAQDAGAG